MAYTDIFDQRNSDYGNTIKNSRSNSMKNKITSTFFDSPSYKSVQKLTANSSILTSLDSWIVDDSKTVELKTITLIPDQTISSGDYIIWNSEYWINLITDFQGDIYYRGSIKKCESSLKWLDSLGSRKEAYFTLAASDQRGLGIEEGKVMILPSERRYITLQNNTDTLKIVKNQRFIFDNGKTFKVVSSNTLKTGLISMELEETEFSVELDNLSERIANYYSHKYTLDISNGSSANLSIGNTLQLNVVTKDNGVVTNLPVTYSTTDNTIVTCNASGLLNGVANGTVNMTVALLNDPTVFKVIAIVVSAVIVDSYVLEISGSDFVRIGTSQTYSGLVKNNSVTDGSKTVSWLLKGDDGVTNTTLANITAQSTSSITIKANSSVYNQYVKVIGVCIQDGSITTTKRILIKSLV